MQLFCNDQIINQVTYYFNIIIYYLDYMLYFILFALMKKQMLGLGNIWKMLENKS